MKRGCFTCRRHLFEFNDQPWLRGWLREAYLDGLNLAFRAAGQYRRLHRLVRDWAFADGDDKTRRSLLDLASGGGGVVDTIVRQASRDGTHLPRFVLSDFYPSLPHFEALEQRHGSEAVTYMAVPVAAQEVPADAPRLRSIFTAFHHFDPPLARAILADAARHSDGLLVVEPFERSLRHFLMVLFGGPFLYMLSPFFSRRCTAAKFLVCTLFPIVPLMLWFDACVSVLRVYTTEETRLMFPADLHDDFDLRCGELTYRGLFRAPYFCATRRRKPEPALPASPARSMTL